jgi:hypothetical protein
MFCQRTCLQLRFRLPECLLALGFVCALVEWQIRPQAEVSKVAAEDVIALEQGRTTDCGPVALYVACKLCGIQSKLEEIRGFMLLA